MVVLEIQRGKVGKLVHVLEIGKMVVTEVYIMYVFVNDWQFVDPIYFRVTHFQGRTAYE